MPIFQAHALRKQISFLQQYQQQQQQATNENDTQKVQDDVLLSILPAGYDWNQAVLKMATVRSRAFWLVDLAAIIHRLVSWQKLRTSPSKKQGAAHHPRIKFLYHVSANAHAQLLTVLHRFSPSVGLVTTTKFDLEQCRKVLLLGRQSSEGGGNHRHHQVQLLYDKPDGYLRTAVLQKSPSSAEPTRNTTVDNDDNSSQQQPHGLVLSCLAVDGPDEVQRIVDSLQRMVKRRQRRRNGRDDSYYSTTTGQPLPPRLDFILRLPSSPTATASTERNPDDDAALLEKQWKSLWQATLERIQQTSSSTTTTTPSSSSAGSSSCSGGSHVRKLVGVSVDLAHVRGAALMERLQTMESFLKYHYCTSSSEHHQPMQRLDLTGLPMEDSEPDDFKAVVDWWNHVLSSSSSTSSSSCSNQQDGVDTRLHSHCDSCGSDGV